MNYHEFFDFVVSPILVAFVIGTAGSFFAVLRRLANQDAEMNRRLNDHDTALAVLIQQVNPPGGKSLRDLLSEIQLDVARHSPQPFVLQPAPIPPQNPPS